jgi:hypothetical protein
MSRKRKNPESAAYAALRGWNDGKAIARGRVGRRVARRAYGKLSGRLARKLFR